MDLGHGMASPCHKVYVSFSRRGGSTCGTGLGLVLAMAGGVRVSENELKTTSTIGCFLRTRWAFWESDPLQRNFCELVFLGLAAVGLCIILNIVHREAVSWCCRELQRRHESTFLCFWNVRQVTSMLKDSS